MLLPIWPSVRASWWSISGYCLRKAWARISTPPLMRCFYFYTASTCEPPSVVGILLQTVKQRVAGSQLRRRNTCLAHAGPRVWPSALKQNKIRDRSNIRAVYTRISRLFSHVNFQPKIQREKFELYLLIFFFFSLKSLKQTALIGLLQSWVRVEVVQHLAYQSFSGKEAHRIHDIIKRVEGYWIMLESTHWEG